MSSLARIVRSDFSKDAVGNLLREAAKVGATELLFKVPLPPMMRTSSYLHPVMERRLAPRDTVEVAMSLAALAGVEISLVGRESTEFAFGLPGVGRFHACVFRQRGSSVVAVRRTELVPPALDELPEIGGSFDLLGQPGLTLVAGPLRTAALHALVAEYNRLVRGHVLMVESPLAYLHKDDRATVTQVEAGIDCADAATAVRRAVRLGVDQLVIGDIDERATADAALAAAEAGIPVLAGIGAGSTKDATWFVARLFDGIQRMDAERRLENVARSPLFVGGR